jgi:leucyl/phenylalanyl-tRNA---protein transferase
MSAPLDPSLLLKAYAAGIFPMADGRDAPDVYWVEPKKRGILPLEDFRLSRSLAKTLKSGRFKTTLDRAFGDVVALCAAEAPDRPSTWINDQIETAVTQLHNVGSAHSIETWADGVLVGGLYGIRLGRAFFGESMFSRATDASKVALAHLVARMRVGGFTLLDCQFITPHLASLGAIEIGRNHYMTLLSSALSASGSADFRAFDALPDEALGSPPRTTVVSGPVSGWRIVQALVQTS